MNNPTRETCFKPGHLYPIETVADILDVNIRWVKEHLIYNKACMHKHQGSVYVFRGEWLVNWASSDATEAVTND